MTEREAILLVGGEGTRLRPLTAHTPKPMLPVAGVPITVHQILRARDAGVTRIVLGTAYRAEVFSEQLGDGSALGVEIAYAHEEQPLGTGGAIRNAAAHLRSADDDPVLILNGDVLSGVDMAALVAGHVAEDAAVTLHLTRVDDPRRYGLVPTDGEGRVLEFLEKPETVEQIVTDQINAGCYVFRRDVIDSIAPDRVVSVEREVFPVLLKSGALVRGVVDESYWLDLGTPLAFVQGSCDLVRGLAPSPAVANTGEALVLDGADVATSADVRGGSTIGANVVVSAGSVVDGSVVFDDAIVGEASEIRGSIIGRGARIGEGCSLDGVVVGDGAVVGARNEIREGARVWPQVAIPDLAIRYSSDA